MVVGPDDFEKIRLIGRGDVGRVYLVLHKETKELYAMKLLTKKDMLERNKVKRALTEREILATADHPFIVTMYWSFQTSDYLYFVMEYCGGGEFYRTLQKQPGKCLPEESVRFYAAEVLLALEYLHMMGFVYRDLKPENILLHASGHLMLTDFDLSKQAATQNNPTLIKRIFAKNKIHSKPELLTNSFVGTEEYIAPEVITGYGHSSAVDWWTFGILIYEMLYGATPFKGADRDATFRSILGKKLDFPEPHRYPVSSDAKTVIKKLLNPDPDRRLGTEHGAADVKDHKFFRGKINWALIRNHKPPFIPVIGHPTDTRNFRNFESEAIDDGVISDTLDANDPFHDFKPVQKLTKERHSSISLKIK